MPKNNNFVSFKDDDVMTVVENHCPLHQKECELVEVGGISTWLDQMGFAADQFTGTPEISEWPAGYVSPEDREAWIEQSSELGLLVYVCPEGCELRAFALKGGDWVANGNLVGKGWERYAYN